ncbi:ATP-binding protein [Xanthobacter autotrophicus DSM 431]|uniref:sensor histidine kinase n=1 Tax=Xanthobacter nonsaccharivorans TaxID=3119912 RepID=UPI00372B8E28
MAAPAAPASGRREAARGWRMAGLFLALWIGGVSAFAAVSLRTAYERAEEALDAAGTALHRVISQRVAQHDAHLTSLAALVQVADPPPREALRLVALSIMRFYPRITSIRVLEQTPSGAIETVMSTSDAARPVPAFAPAVFAQRPGEARAYVDAAQDAAQGATPDAARNPVPDPAAPRRYFLGKRTGASARPLAMIVEIDPALLVEAEERPASAAVKLSLDDHLLVDSAAREDAAADGAGWSRQLTFTRTVASQNQPLRLELERRLVLADVLAPRPLLAVAGLALVGLLALAYALRQRREARRSRDAVRLAEERSALLERETRLAHASRVNSLGELASGIAHELTQPLTALLSQSQAAVRLAAPGGDPRLSDALQANVREARRAGDILARMREYISNRPVERAPTDLNAVVADVAALARAGLAEQGIRLVTELDGTLPEAVVNPIEMEQVLHNLVRNAADALAAPGGPERTITIRTRAGRLGPEIDVSDTGPGIPPEVTGRLFEPFFTTKHGGMGLGLSLCATLLERVGGRIAPTGRPGEGATFTVVLPAAPARRQAAQ